MHVALHRQQVLPRTTERVECRHKLDHSSPRVTSLPVTTLLLPGLDGTGRLFAPLLSVLSGGAEPQVVAYDKRVAQGYEALEESIARALPVGPFAIVAESFAGPLALRLALRRPRGLVAVALVATFVTNPIPGPLATVARALARPWLPIWPPLPRFAARRWLLGEDAPEALVRLFSENLREVAPGVMAARIRAVLDVDASDALVRCPVPVLHLTAKNDRLVPRTAGEAMHRLRPDLERAEVDAPHLVLQVAPAASAEILGAFLRRVTGA